ncbi:MAG: EamA family transporter [Eubacteriales bacterium]
MSDSLASKASILSPKANQTWVGLFNLFVVYIVWGSTYLAIRVAVREGAGFPPFSLGAMRLLTASGLLLLGVALARLPLRLTKQDFIVLALSGMLLWLGGNGMVVWAEQRAESGYAALMVSTIPIWVAVIEALLDRKMPSNLLIASLLTGFAGIGLLTAPILKTGAQADVLIVLALMAAPVCWGLGTVLQHRRPVSLNPFVSSGYQQFFGGLGFFLVSIALGEHLPNPTPEAWWAWGYLVVFGSLFGFSSFLMAIRLLPINIAMTYAYVNPVVAVILGRLILHEPISIWTVSGTSLVLLGVAGVFRNQNKK